jgi:hypothetical protein
MQNALKDNEKQKRHGLARFSRIRREIMALEVEAPSGLEPLNRGFADLSLSHLGTTPH